MKRWMNTIVAILLIIPISGCTMGLEMKKKHAVTEEQIISGVSES